MRSIVITALMTLGVSFSGYVCYADCMLQSNGQTVCGAGECELNADGTVACADVPWGQCQLGSEGYWACE